MSAPPDDPLGAFCRENHAALEPTASGPLDGLMFAVKDVFDVAGSRTGFGQPSWLASHAPAAATAPAVERLLGAGARLVGRTISDELTYSLTGENAHYGTPLNPRCPERVPGGSSSGSASAVAGGLCDVSLGTDCAGSVRIPASYCGLYGLRPTHGRVPLDGVCPFAPSFDTVGWLAREPDVLERAGRALLTPSWEGGSSGVRVLVARDAFALVDPRVREALAEPLRLVQEAVGSSEEITVTGESGEGLERWMRCFRVIQAYEIWRSLGGWVQEAKPGLGPGVSERIELASRVSAREAEEERGFHAQVVRRLNGLLEDGDLLCLPTAPGPAPKRGAPPSEAEETVRYKAISLLCIAGLGGLPQISLPLGSIEGCPLGLSIVGARRSDESLLALANRLR